MIKVAIISESEKEELVGKLQQNGVYYNPVKDSDENWVISDKEINESDITWLKQKQLVDFNPKKFDFLNG